MLRIILAAATVLALSSCAGVQGGDPAAAERDCFRVLDVDGYSIEDRDHVKVRISPSREYRLTIMQNTRGLDYGHVLSLHSRTSFVCVGDGLGVELRGGDTPIAYQVSRIERIPPETAANGA